MLRAGLRGNARDPLPRAGATTAPFCADRGVRQEGSLGTDNPHRWLQRRSGFCAAERRDQTSGSTPPHVRAGPVSWLQSPSMTRTWLGKPGRRAPATCRGERVQRQPRAGIPGHAGRWIQVSSRDAAPAEEQERQVYLRQPRRPRQRLCRSRSQRPEPLRQTAGAIV